MSALITFFLALLVSWTMSFFNSAQAGWFGKDKDDKPRVSEITPPPQQELDERCGELRRKIGAINSSNGVVKTLKIPQREWLLAKNKKCMQKWGEQEYKYLRNAEIQPDHAPTTPEPQKEQ